MMNWKRYNYYYDVSTAGLLRRRTSAPGNPAGKLLSPSIRHNGSIVYYMGLGGGKQTTKTVTKIVWSVFYNKRVFSEKWCKTIKKYVVEYNRVVFGHASKEKKSVDYLSKPMYDYRKFNDPWNNYRPHGVLIGEYNFSDICPLR
jgi:hypothetical protein